MAALINRAFAVEAWFVDGDRTSPGEVRRLIEGPRGGFLLATDERGLAGCVYAEQRTPGRGYIGLLAVDETRQARGIGQTLMALAEGRLAASGCRVVEITVVNLRGELFPLYERLGYRQDGPIVTFPRVAKLPCHLVTMTKRLAPDPRSPFPDP